MFSLAERNLVASRRQCEETDILCGQILRAMFALAKSNTSLLQAFCHSMASFHPFPVNCYVSEFD